MTVELGKHLLIMSCGQTSQKNGYFMVSLFFEGKHKRLYLHRLVAETFIPNPEGKAEVNHKDGNKLNNNLENLEWVTRGENLQHAYDTGLRESSRERARYMCKTNEKILQYREEQKVKIQQFSETGQLLAEYDSIRAAAKATDVPAQNISSVSLGRRGTAGGFIWKRTNHEENVQQYKTNRKAVEQYNLEGQLLATYPSIAEASRKTDILDTGISAVCSGKRSTSGGYKWKYVEEMQAFFLTF